MSLVWSTLVADEYSTEYIGDDDGQLCGLDRESLGGKEAFWAKIELTVGSGKTGMLMLLVSKVWAILKFVIDFFVSSVFLVQTGAM